MKAESRYRHCEGAPQGRPKQSHSLVIANPEGVKQSIFKRLLRSLRSLAMTVERAARNDGEKFARNDGEKFARNDGEKCQRVRVRGE